MKTLEKLPVIDQAQSTTGCCTLIKPDEWDEKVFEFKDKLFVKVSTQSFLYMPLNMNSVMKRAQAKIDAAGARPDEFIILSHDSSPWHADHYMAVSQDVPDLQTERLSGTFITKVFEGPFKNIGKWQRELSQYVISQNKISIKNYFFYTTCPSCAKTYGKNYVVGFAQVI